MLPIFDSLFSPICIDTYTVHALLFLCASLLTKRCFSDWLHHQHPSLYIFIHRRYVKIKHRLWFNSSSGIRRVGAGVGKLATSHLLGFGRYLHMCVCFRHGGKSLTKRHGEHHQHEFSWFAGLTESGNWIENRFKVKAILISQNNIIFVPKLSSCFLQPRSFKLYLDTLFSCLFPWLNR